MEKKYFCLLILLLTVGFASVNTFLDLNGKVDLSMLENDLDVVFKEVLLDNENQENVLIVENGLSFIYSSDELTGENNSSNINYVVMNKSHQYDVEVKVRCTTDYEEYISYNGTLDNQDMITGDSVLIEAGEVKSGTVITELIKQNNTDESLALKCSLYYVPVGRESIVENEYIISFDTGYEENVSDIKVEYYGEYGKLPELTRDGYKFLGWYTEDDVRVESNSLVKIKDNHTLYAKWKELCKFDVGTEWLFDYSGKEETLPIECDGNYKLETWGAQGGSYDTTYYGGYGSYAKGEIFIEKNQVLYINVGGKGNKTSREYEDGKPNTSGGYNGGGDAYNLWTAGVGSTISQYNISGGGATHVALKTGELMNLGDDVLSIIQVSSGGGGAQGYVNGTSYVFCSGGNAGGIQGSRAICNTNGTNSITQYANATQTSPGSSSFYNYATRYGAFGKGGIGYSGGGGGWYGGTGNYGVTGGGSSYVGNSLLSNKAMYCYGCTTSNEEATKTISTTCVSSTPTANCAKQGNGYAKITYLGD